MAEQLSEYVEVWWRSACDFADLADTLAIEQWAAPTDLPGWDVRAVVSHVAHLEGLLGGAPEESAEVTDAPHLTSPMSRFTEIGVLTRRTADPATIVAEIRRYTTARHDQLRVDPPTDPTEPAPGVFGLLGWSVGTLLRNRPLDLWMHEQDVRRAVGRPGGLDAPGAAHATDYLLEGLGFVLAKRAGGAPGTTLAVYVEGSAPAGFLVDDRGRGRPLEELPADPTVTLRADRETFLLLAGGRDRSAADRVIIEGDRALGERVVARLDIVP